MPTTKDSINNANIQWDESGQPISNHYGDYYFSRVSGLDESRYVFLQHNNLTERFQQLEPLQNFTIAETGFGTGLNFLATWQLWEKQAPATAQLHFISVEKHPLSPEELTRSLRLWPELKAYADILIAAYPPNHPGTYRLNLTDKISLSLMIGEAEHCFKSLSASVDAWFLDGFTPSKNPAMWTERLFKLLARNSQNSTTYSTFTAASIVRRGLEAAGFSIEKAKGYGLKREMLHGYYQENDEVTDSTPGWFCLPKAPPPSEVIIIGAGIAGCSSARALADKGIKVALLDQHKEIANEASGNPQGVLYAKLPAQPTKASRIHWAGLHYSLRQIKQLIPNWEPSGVLQLGTSESEQAKQQKLSNSGSYPNSEVQYISAQQTSEIAGIPLSHPGLWFPQAGWISPKTWCQTLINHPNINVIKQCTVTGLKQVEKQGEKAEEKQELEKDWLLETSKGPMRCDTVILCCANQARQFSYSDWLPTKSIRGQVSSVTTQQSSDLQCVLCSKGYVSPPVDNQWCFGATFNLHEDSNELRDIDHQENLAHIDDISPALAANLDSVTRSEWQGRVAFRCTSPDYLPMVGPVPIFDKFVEDFQELRHNAKAHISTQATYTEGLYVNIAHGSKGLITAPLCAELLANQICNEPLPLEKELIHSLLPARFIVKKLAKKAI